VSPVISLIMQPFEYNIKFHELIGTKKQSVFRTNTGSGALKGCSAHIVQPQHQGLHLLLLLRLCINVDIKLLMNLSTLEVTIIFHFIQLFI
jgi:hypothetical protein